MSYPPREHVFELRSSACAGGNWLATCGLSAAVLAVCGYFAEGVCREWQLTGRHFSKLNFRFWLAPARG
jgi:hypothetical protein